MPFLAVNADPEAPEQPVVPHFVLKPILLAIALMAGEVASLLLSRMTIPITYYMLNMNKKKKEIPV